MLDLRRLDLLHRYAVAGSIAAVAAEMGFSASAVSQQLATLEREAGTPLLERTARSSRLTDAGRELAAHAARILGEVEIAEARLAERAGAVTGMVRVACLPGLAPRLAPSLAAVQQEHPQLRVIALEAGSRAAVEAVTSGRCDIAVVDDWGDEHTDLPSTVTAYPAGIEQIVLAVPAPHPLAGRQPRGPRIGHARLAEAITEATWLCAPSGELSRIAGDRLLTRLDARPRQRWEFEGLAVLAAVVAAGAGIALLPVGNATHQSRIATRALPWPMHRRIVVLIRAGTERDPAQRACLDATAAALRG